MYRGTVVEVFKDSLRVPEDALAAIGIFDGSNCWGAWIPDRSELSASGQYAHSSKDHLLLSPFEPKSWPILFRVEMYLSNDRPGTLALALGPLARQQLSIHSIEATPAGHHHAVANLIGEAIHYKSPDFPSLQGLKNLRHKSRTFMSLSAWDLIHESYAPDMLRYCKELEDAVLMADDETPFLREIFLDPKHKRYQKGVVYSYFDLPPGPIREVGKAQSTRAVTCKWLPNHAFFSLYRHSEPFELKYSRSNQGLRPKKGIDTSPFEKGLQLLHPPFTTIGTFNLDEHFLRVIPSTEDRENRTLRVTIPFSATFAANSGSLGFQHKLYTEIWNGGFNLRGVSMLTEERTLAGEVGKLRLLIASATPDLTASSIASASDNVDRAADRAAAALGPSGCQMHCSRAVVQSLNLPILFFSTKLDWLRNARPNLWPRIQEMALDAGFRAITGDMRARLEFASYVPEVLGQPHVTDSAITLIRNSACFLQLVPRTVFDRAEDDAGSMSWLEFELGAALMAGMEYRIIVDRDAGDLPKWKNVLRVAGDVHLELFSSSSEDECIAAVIREALRQFIRPSSLAYPRL